MYVRRPFGIIKTVKFVVHIDADDCYQLPSTLFGILGHIGTSPLSYVHPAMQENVALRSL